MIVVTVAAAACYVGRQVEFAKERHRAVESHHTEKGSPLPNGPNDPLQFTGSRPRAPWPLRWFGEEGYGAIMLDAYPTGDEVARIVGLFPEASIFIRGPDSPQIPPSRE
jgi:hypothetical protein